MAPEQARRITRTRECQPCPRSSRRSAKTHRQIEVFEHLLLSSPTSSKPLLLIAQEKDGGGDLTGESGDGQVLGSITADDGLPGVVLLIISACGFCLMQTRESCPDKTVEATRAPPRGRRRCASRASAQSNPPRANQGDVLVSCQRHLRYLLSCRSSRRRSQLGYHAQAGKYR
jgi:hypothetical protein